MKKISNCEEISLTAKLSAYFQTFSDIPFAKEIAEESGSEEAFKELCGGMDLPINNFAVLSLLSEARYKITNHILEQWGINQILEIASGFSPRGLAMTENPEVVYVITDLPKILEEEKTIVKKILARLNSRRPNLHFQVVSALDRESLSKTANFFRPNQPLAIISEGLLTYFNREEKKNVADNIHELLKRRGGGVWVTPDVSTKQFMERIFQINENSRQINLLFSDITGRDLEDNAFLDENDIRQFFEKTGFKIQEYQYSNINVIKDLFSVKLWEFDLGAVFKILQGRKTLILTPYNNTLPFYKAVHHQTRRLDNI